MKTLMKTLVGTVAAGAVAMASATPAMARDYYGRDHHGISAGEVIAGVAVLGGIAALASASSHHHNYRYEDHRYRGYDRYRGYRGYGRYGDPRSAVEQCIRAAQRTANRYAYGGRARVTQIRDVDRKRGGWKVEGRIAVNARTPYYRGWNRRYRGYDTGRFDCRVRYGRVVDLDFHGIRGL